MTRCPRPLAALALTLAAALPAAAMEFTSEREIDAVLAQDLNGDGKKEIIWQAGRTLTFLFYREPRGYSLKEDSKAEFYLPPEVAAYAFGDVDGKPGPELVAMTGSGIRAWKIEGNKVVEPPIEVLALATAFEGTTLEKPRPRDFLVDLDGDGDLDIVVPRKGFLAFYAQAAPGEFELAQKVPIEMETTLSMGGGAFDNRLLRAVSFPKFWLADFDGDKKSDFMYFRGAVLQVHARDGDGLFSAAPTRSFDFNKFVKRRRRRRDLFDYYREVSPEVADVDGDGRADVAIMLPGKGKVGVFRAAGAKPYSEGSVVALSGWTFRREGIPMMRDLNHDGRPDLVLLNIPQLGFWDILEIFFSRKIEVKTFFYLARPDGTFPVADHEFAVTVPLILSVTRETQRIETPFLMAFGDVNGDGLDDMLTKEVDDQLWIRLGQQGGVFGKAVDRKIATRDTRGMASEPALVTDLNGDGVDDVILHHQDFEQKIYVLEVLRMKRE
ncbi:MAG: VCBS repeat-containing protein [Planctomycetes bacterium]|nr:VCBS repeat-containing protein [Planctomycetota bacterium]